MIVDTHAYCLPPRLRDIKAGLPAADHIIAKAIHRHPDGGWVLPMSSPERIRASMRDAGIDRSVLIAFPWASASLCRENNDFILAEAEAAPRLFDAVCSVQPKDPRFLAEARRCLDAGAVGIKINPAWQGYSLDDARLDKLLALVARKGAYLLTHIDQPFRISPTSPGHLVRLAARNPKARIVAAHMGGLAGLYASFGSTAKALKNVWFDTAVSETMEFVSYYCQSGLADRVLFGSDYPFNYCHSQKTVLQRLRKLRLGHKSETAILGGNWLRLRKTRR